MVLLGGQVRATHAGPSLLEDIKSPRARIKIPLHMKIPLHIEPAI